LWITPSTARFITWATSSRTWTDQRLVSELGAGPFFVLPDVSFEQVTSRGEALRSGSSRLSCMTSIGTAPHCPNALSW
jgi:hypothetical protein